MQGAPLPPLGSEDADKALVQSQWLSQHGAAPGQPSTSAAAAPPRSIRWSERAGEPQGPTQGPPAAAAVPPIAGTGEVSRFTLLRERLRARLLLGAGSSAIREVSPPSPAHTRICISPRAQPCLFCEMHVSWDITPEHPETLQILTACRLSVRICNAGIVADP